MLARRQTKNDWWKCGICSNHEGRCSEKQTIKAKNHNPSVLKRADKNVEEQKLKIKSIR